MIGSALQKVSLQFIPRRFAGHSKWSNIRHIKAKKDGERSAMFLRLCQRIKVAINEGGNADPQTNVALAQTIEVAKRNSMPAATIENCIKSAKEDKSNLKSVWFEVKGPSGCFVIIQTLTAHHAKTKTSIASILNKHNAKYADRGCKHLFIKKGEIVAIPPSGISNIEEVVVDHAIECGAEEVDIDENEEGAYKFICEYDMLKHVESKLKYLKYAVKSADLNFISTLKASLSDSDLQTVGKLIIKLEDHPDVVAIYDNVE